MLIHEMRLKHQQEERLAYLDTMAVHVRHNNVSLGIHRNVAWVTQLTIAVTE